MKNRKKQLDEKERQSYLRGLKRYKEKGVLIYIDDKLADEKDLEVLFEIQEDGSFYMGDYIGAEAGCLIEIRFDKVYNK